MSTTDCDSWTGVTEDAWPQVQPLKSAIAEAGRHLAELYSQRRTIIDAMAQAGMTRRQIGAVWGVSNVAVTAIINRNKGEDE